MQSLSRCLAHCKSQHRLAAILLHPMHFYHHHQHHPHHYLPRDIYAKYYRGSKEEKITPTRERVEGNVRMNVKHQFLNLTSEENVYVGIWNQGDVLIKETK